MIELSHISKDFGSGPGQVHAVRDVSLHIAPGEIFGIIGYSGAGKSTLVRCMNLLEEPTSGRVTVDGKTLADIPSAGEGKALKGQGRGVVRMPPPQLREMRKKMGMIFQQFNLMPSRTVAENVAFPLKGSGLSREAVAAKVEELLKLVESMLAYSRSDAEADFMLQSLLCRFFAHLARGISRGPEQRMTRRERENLYIHQAMEYIRNNYANGITVADVAGYVALNRSYLFTLFRRVLGVSPQECLTQFRLTRAKEQLTLTDASVANIAMSCG